jgi:hypothetical protein
MSVAKKLREQIEGEPDLEKKIKLLTEAVADSVELPHNIATTEHLKDLEIRMMREIAANQKEINMRLDSMGKETNARFESLNKDMNVRFESLGKEMAVHSRWIVGLIVGLGLALHYWK